MAEDRKRIKLNIGRFLKIIPERLKRIKNSSDEEMKPLYSYKPNALAAAIHPKEQFVTVEAIEKISSDTLLFTLLPDKEKGTASLAPFQAGQYISVSVTSDGKTYSRPYSICSSPSGFSKKYEIAVKRTPGGTVTGILHEIIKPGDRLTVSDPCGSFTYEPIRDAETVIGCAGGVGITPFISMIRAIKDGSEDFSLTLLYGCKSPQDALFRDLLDKTDDPRIKVVYVFEENAPKGCESGYINAELIKKYAPEDKYSLFVCGPHEMYTHIEKEAEKLGIRRKYLREDARGQIIYPEKEPDFSPAEKDEYAVTVLSSAAATQLRCKSNETLLSAMERAGVIAPSRCRSGECGFCHSRLVSGVCYTPVRADGRRAADKVYGYIHPCCAFPRSDMVIEIKV